MTDQFPIFLGSEIEQGDPDNSFFHVIPVPYEHTVSYGDGTAKGPAEILDASWQLEVWDGKSTPTDLGIYTADAVDCNAAPEEVMARIADSVADAVNQGAMPIAIGGEHSVTYGVIQGLLRAGLEDFGVVQIDAHADLRDAYEDDPLSHASVMRRIVELDIPLYQLGVRAYCAEEMQARKDFGVYYRDADDIAANNVQSIELPEDFPKNVFFTLDIDGMDPSIFPSTGTPVPGGLGWYQTLNLFESVAKQRTIIGFDLMEFAPIKGFHAYEFAAAQLLYKMMGIVERTHTGK
ncbi:MAG: Agmatinase (EC [uncultured Thiotrichaceae bacterium]|uniref:Agmatinase (EC) n=1 Tax=uncultured Thiotrichaceae bacterium TaxID=298394 RepID=A0A6S6STH3_9GAMM|nr:MAG: Agmatinase (EC [uncultured Thiotrichaceae bacterium]